MKKEQMSHLVFSKKKEKQRLEMLQEGELDF